MKNTYPLSNAELYSLLEDYHEIFSMYRELERLVLEESRLKKHHRAYIHVSEEIEEVVRRNRMKLIEKAGTNVNDYLGSRNAASAKREKSECESCPCNGCDSCGDCAVSPCFTEEAQEDAIVTMSKTDFDGLIDDVLTLAELVDMVCYFRCEDLTTLKKYGKLIPELAEYEKSRVKLYKDCTFEAESVMDKLESAELTLM
jgi:hypothetical protein